MDGFLPVRFQKAKNKKRTFARGAEVGRYARRPLMAGHWWRFRQAPSCQRLACRPRTGLTPSSRPRGGSWSPPASCPPAAR
ncbi:protein of unknown function [Methylorubrum extorquens]|uniref:Uncharacterized protein n=1 Tax=Methylorubrum extorquens TaxID=408 RepID=A0A2N9AJM6_METEX|nr:protein of unknown function [Methylorubrum extorquens]